MKVIVFMGATLRVSEARASLEAEYRPPAALGDVYRAAREQPWAIGIVDGYYEHVPAVWHKEILWALQRGVRVYGAASMGALRAAELERYGMVGVGEIFAAFAQGELEDDDEVAVAESMVNGCPEAVSVAMVDIRATLRAAVGAGVIDARDEAQLLAIAKDTFYPERTYEQLFDEARGRVTEASTEALRGWLPSGRVEQKRADAFALLERIASDKKDTQRSAAHFHFERTSMWLELEKVVRADLGQAKPTTEAAEDDERILDEARLADPEWVAQLTERARARALASEIHAYEGVDEPPDRVEAAAMAFRSTRGLYQPEALARWMAERDLSTDELVHWMKEDARLERLGALLMDETRAQLLREVRASSRWGELRQRAEKKAELLARQGRDDPDPNDPLLPLSEAEELCQRTSEQTRGAWSRMVLREAWYRRLGT